MQTTAHTWPSVTQYYSADLSQDHVASGHTCSRRRLALNKPGRDCSSLCESLALSLCTQGVHWGFSGKPQKQLKSKVTSVGFAPRFCSILGEVISQTKRSLSGKNPMVIADSPQIHRWKSSGIRESWISNQSILGSAITALLIGCLRVSWDSLNDSTVPRGTENPRPKT